MAESEPGEGHFDFPVLLLLSGAGTSTGVGDGEYVHDGHAPASASLGTPLLHADTHTSSSAAEDSTTPAPIQALSTVRCQSCCRVLPIHEDFCSKCGTARGQLPRATHDSIPAAIDGPRPSRGTHSSY
jgi:hypothetical protein